MFLLLVLDQLPLIGIYGIWNTTVGGNSIPSTPGLGIGQYAPGEAANNAFDSNTTTKYLNFGSCAVNVFRTDCGVNTGFYTELQRGPSRIIGLRLCTANDWPQRDPLTVSLEGSNLSGVALTLGSSWTPIYIGNSGLLTDPGRYSCGLIRAVNNTVYYENYRFLVRSQRGSADSTQYSEVELHGY